MRIQDHPIIDFPHGDRVSFTFEGQELSGVAGEPIAAALHAAGVRLLRHTPAGRPRGLFCAALDRQGKEIAAGIVLRAQRPAGFDRTALITLEVPAAHAFEARGLRLRRKAGDA
ncbi:MAG: 2Fe-2S iron-sulfur cluster-binding protein [Bacillota bacterium]|nr:2Fe-2S iron-sulfur cluster-binding protein [Bacillota bacterium]